MDNVARSPILFPVNFGGSQPYKFLGLCNGYHVGVERFSDETYAWAGVQLALCRIEIAQLARDGHPELQQYFMVDGWRFVDDRDSMIRIESRCTEEEFRANMHAWCMDALRSCAFADAYDDEEMRAGLY